jgi:Domain of unknown function (DUF4440)
MDHELIEHCERLDHAVRYDIGALRLLYSDDFLIHRLNANGETMILEKQALLWFFAGQTDKATAPQDGDSVEYLHASRSGDTGMVVGKRTIQSSGEPEELIFTQIWRRHLNSWQMIRESVYAQTK